MIDVDLLLAILHHLLAFGLLAILTMELMLLRPGLGGDALARLGRIDMAYGLLAGLLIAVGICRVLFGAKGLDFYLYNLSFWLKMAAFLAVGILSIPPTRHILRWRRHAASDAGYIVPEGEIRRTRRFVHAGAAVFVLIPIFAALMARGYGL